MSFLPDFFSKTIFVLVIKHTSHVYSTSKEKNKIASSLTFTVLPSKFNDKNYLKFNSGYNKICVNEKALKNLSENSDAVYQALLTTEVKES